LILNYPFMQLRIPPVGFGRPLGELLLIGILLTTDVPRVLARMNTVICLVPFLVWWSWGLARLAFDGAEHGFWAFRDSTQLVESLFLIGGFALAGTIGMVENLSRWLRVITIVSCLYGLLFICADAVTALSPTLPGASEQPIPIFGSFATTATMLLLGAFMCMVSQSRTLGSRMRCGLVAGFLVAFTLLVIQARTTYLQLLSLAVLMFIARPRALNRLGFALPVLFLLLVVIAAFDLEVSGRLTSKISVSFFLEHIESIFGVASGHGGLADAAEGVTLRWRWWDRLYDELTRDAPTMIMGLGYGIPLTDFRDTFNVVTREPHNSVLSVTARLGLVGICSWIWMQVELFAAGFRAYRDCRRCGWSDGANLVLVILAFAVLTLASCFGEDTMEKPYNAIPYYAFWGFALRIAYRVRAEAGRLYQPHTMSPVAEVPTRSPL
jgi:O-antigen ligase